MGRTVAGTLSSPIAGGRSSAGRDDMGGTAASRLTTAGSGVNGLTLEASGGSQSHVLTVAQMPAHAHGVTDPGHTHSVYDPGHAHTLGRNPVNGSSPATAERVTGVGAEAATSAAVTGISLYAAATGVSVQSNGSGSAHPNVQPTIVFNKIIFAGD